MWRRESPIPIYLPFFTQYPQINTKFLSNSSSTGNFSIPNLQQKCCNPQIFLEPVFDSYKLYKLFGTLTPATLLVIELMFHAQPTLQSNILALVDYFCLDLGSSLIHSASLQSARNKHMMAKIIRDHSIEKLKYNNLLRSHYIGGYKFVVVRGQYLHTLARLGTLPKSVKFSRCLSICQTPGQ